MANEKRSICGTEVRAEGDGAKGELVGTGVVYNTLSAPIGGQFREKFLPGSLTPSLQSGNDVKLLWSHDSGVVLGRTKIPAGQSGSLQLTDTRDGLHFRCKLNMDSPQIRSCYEAVRSGLVDEMSFGFIVPPGGDTFEQNRGNSLPTRIVSRADLSEISCVAFPAYPSGTSVSARAERRSLAQYIVAPASDVRAYSRAEADALIDGLNRRRAAELAAEIRSTHDFEIDDTVMKGCERGVVTQVNGNLLTVETGRGTAIWHCADCSSIRDASDFEEYDEDKIDGEKE